MSATTPPQRSPSSCTAGLAPAPVRHLLSNYATSNEKEKDEDIHDSVRAESTSSLTELPGDAPPGSASPPRYSIYSTGQKRLIVLGASMGALISPLTGQIYLPALNAIASDLSITPSQVNLTITTYMIFQGITPMFVGGFADGAGRRPAYGICFVVFIAANIGLALSRNYVSLLVVRCLQSAGSSSTIALCQAVVADIVSSAERGQYMAITVIPAVFGPSLGPVIGGMLSEYLGWRSIFWFLAIFAAVIFIFLVLFLPETCRKIVDDGSILPHPLHRTAYQLIRDFRRKRKTMSDPEALCNSSSTDRPPLRIQVPNLLESIRLTFQKEIGLLLVFSSLLFSGFYAIATAMPLQLSENYGYSDLTVGLMYLPTAGGSIVAAFAVGPAINWNYRRHARKLGLPVDKSRQQDLTNFPIERARLEVGNPLLFLAAAVMLVWGWAIDHRAHPALLCVLLFLNGVGMMGFNNAANVLLIDITPGKAGAAVAANNLTRCLLGAAGTAIIIPMINAMGSGWAFFIVGMLYIVFSPALLLIMRNGIVWRKEIRKRDERRQKLRDEKKMQVSS